ncbi:hypothetical protein [Sediminibacterium sp.]|uniref:hypothetical protein n=1 Tax=Sediminibacterium sp. TaxID=1917865 RepID=UPI003F6983AB
MLQLTLITHSITQPEAAALANTIQSILGPTTNIVSISPYPKFPDSYIIHLETIVTPNSPAALIHQATPQNHNNKPIYYNQFA